MVEVAGFPLLEAGEQSPWLHRGVRRVRKGW